MNDDSNFIVQEPSLKNISLPRAERVFPSYQSSTRCFNVATHHGLARSVPPKVKLFLEVSGVYLYKYTFLEIIR